MSIRFDYLEERSQNLELSLKSISILPFVSSVGTKQKNNGKKR